MSSTHQKRAWDVLLIGGASGTGKSTAAYPLAHQYGAALTEVDDLQRAILAMTTPAQQPTLHYWHTHPEAMEWPAERILELHLSVAEVIKPALETAIANHLGDNRPLVLEGDYLVPSLVMPEQVRAVFLYKPGEMQILKNFLGREPKAGEQNKRARVSYLFGQWLKAESEKHGIPALEARPWTTLINRIAATLKETDNDRNYNHAG